MQAVATTQTVNDIGQIVLGQHFAGQQVTVQPLADGVWYVHSVEGTSQNQELCDNSRDGALPAPAVDADEVLARPASFDSFVGGWDSFNNGTPVEKMVRDIREGRNFGF